LRPRSRILGFGSAVLLVVAGILCAALISGGLGQNLAFALVALGLIEGTSLVFLEVGFSEDHERARDEARAAAQDGDPHEHEPRAKRRLSRPDGSRPRLDRMRGRQRRLR
jgi:hypothetical protein